MPLQRCAQLLGVDLATSCAAAANVEPYICADGTRIWSLMQLERQLRPEVYGRRREAEGIIKVYRGHVERYRGYQLMQGSNWTDDMVTRELAPHRQQLTSRLYQLGLNPDQVAELMDAADRPSAPSVQDSSAYMNALVRWQREGQQAAPSESMNEFIRRMVGR